MRLLLPLILFLIVFTLILIGCSSIQPAPNSDKFLEFCEKLTDDQSYCYSKLRTGTSDKCMILFHGLGDDERAWTQHRDLSFWKTYGARLESLQSRMGDTVPNVILITYGNKTVYNSWLFNDKPLEGRYKRWRSPREAVTEHLVNTVKTLADKYKCTAPYYLWGVSMGGLNAIQLMLRKPEWFDKAVFISPMLPKCDPFKVSEWSCYPKPPDWNLAGGVSMIIKFNFDSYGDYSWYKSDPMVWLDKVDISKLPKIFGSNGVNDPFLLNISGKRFFDKAALLGAHVVYDLHTNEDGHNWFDDKKVYDFLKETK